MHIYEFRIIAKIKNVDWLTENVVKFFPLFSTIFHIFDTIANDNLYIILGKLFSLQ